MKRVGVWRWIAAGWAAAAVAAAAPARVALRLEAAVPSDFVRLDQVVRDPASLPGALRAPPVFLGRAPDTGRTRLVRRAEIVRCLAQAGFSEKDVRLEGDAVRVSRAPRAASPASGTAWAAARDLPAGAVLSAQDVVPRPARPGEEGLPETGLDRIVGRELKRPLPAGAFVAPADLREPLCVRRGEVVRAAVGEAGVSIGFYARALGDARRGEAVRLESLQEPRRVFTGVVEGPGRATLSEGGEP